MSLLHWQASPNDALRQILTDALPFVPREHLRQLDAIVVTDRDPKGTALGVWRQDNTGTRIELYAEPHVREISVVRDGAVRDWALRLFLSHTLFHEVGHHVTRVLNKRPLPRQTARAGDAVEKWAEDYAYKRLQKWANAQTLTPADADAFALALRVLRLETRITPPSSLTPPGTKILPAPSDGYHKAEEYHKVEEYHKAEPGGKT